MLAVRFQNEKINGVACISLVESVHQETKLKTDGSSLKLIAEMADFKTCGNLLLLRNV